MKKKPRQQIARIALVALKDIARWPRNPKQHDDEGIEKSFARHGFVEPLIQDAGTKRIVAGHGRLEVLEKMKAAGRKPPANVVVQGKDWLVPVLQGVRFRTTMEAEAYLLSDNRTEEVGGWVQEALATALKAQADAGTMKGTGFGDHEARGIIGKEIEAQGATVMEGAEAGEDGIKQMSFILPSKQFEKAVAALEQAMKDTSTDNHTDAFLAMLGAYEEARA